MITIFNRRELTITYDLSAQTSIRAKLAEHNVDYVIKFATITPNLSRNQAEYKIYVHEKDYELAMAIINSSILAWMVISSVLYLLWNVISSSDIQKYFPDSIKNIKFSTLKPRIHCGSKIIAIFHKPINSLLIYLDKAWKCWYHYISPTWTKIGFFRNKYSENIRIRCSSKNTRILTSKNGQIKY